MLKIENTEVFGWEAAIREIRIDELRKWKNTLKIIRSE